MTTLAPSPTLQPDGTTLFVGGSWRGAQTTYERFDPSDLSRLTGTFAVAAPDHGKAMNFIRGIHAGVVHVNRETADVEPHVPFGGVKGSSSMSREQGKAARQFFTTTKTVYVRQPPAI